MLNPIPAIDIIEGKCVRLSKGDYSSKKVYDADILDMAKKIEDCGFTRLHMVDLDGARSSHVVNLDTLNKVASNTTLKIDFGGGVKSDKDIQAVFNNGAELVTVGSIAVDKPATFDKWLAAYGPEHLILGADTKDGLISINGWKENSTIKLFDFLESYIKKGIKYILCTDISKDGMLNGTSIKLYQDILKIYPQCSLIASGGVSSIQDLIDLDAAGIPYVVFGKAIYEGRINLKDVTEKFGLTTNHVSTFQPNTKQ